jgi:hypothetical protein
VRRTRLHAPTHQPLAHKHAQTHTLQGGLTWLWLDAPYVIAARKLFNMAVAANDAGDVFPVRLWACCFGQP